MKKQFPIILLLLTIIALVSWQFAFAKPEKPILTIGKVPANQPPDQKAKRLVKVGDITFNMPAYFAEGGGIKEDGTGFDSAKLRNIYYGQCIKRIDGWCSNQTNMGDPDYAMFTVYLDTEESLEGFDSSNKYSVIAPLVGKIPLEELVKKMNEQSNNPINCPSPREMVEQSNNTVSIEEPIIKKGTFCTLSFIYHGLLVRMSFNSGNFSRFDSGKMMQHVTVFLDKYRISTNHQPQ